VTSAVAAADFPRAVSRTRLADGLLFASLFVATFEKVHWNVAGNVSLSDILTILFLAAFALQSRGPWPKTAAILVGFVVALELVYLLGFFNIQTKQAYHQWVKGMVLYAIHLVFLVCAVTYLVRRGQSFYWRALGWFTVGLLANSVYGVLQLLSARAGHNLDHTVLSPLTGGASSINIYGAVNGSSVYRPNALTGDPNHLGIMLDVPLLALTPVYLRLPRGHRLKWPLGLALAFMLLVLLATLSRSGALGIAVGLVILALPYRRFARSRALIAPLLGVAAVVAYEIHRRPHFFSVVIASRLQTGGGSTSAHFSVYSFIPHVLHTNPLLGLGLNTFSVYYEFVTGKTNWGPHSYWVSIIVESGLVGTLLFLVFLRYVFLRLRAARALGRALDAAGDPVARYVRPLAWGMTAALAGTMAANFFYLTMQFYYFYVLVAFALALPLVFAERSRRLPA
jgi:O-Antigen ligase